MPLPERINAIKTFSYNPQQVVEYFREEDPNYDPPLEEVIAYMEEWIMEDFGQNDLSGIILQDEDGNEL